MIKFVAVLNALILVMSCSDGKSKKSDPVSPVADNSSNSSKETPEGCMAKNQVFDETNSTCRSPSEKECYESNRSWSNNSCYDSGLISSTTSKNILELDQHCEKTSRGAYFNCKNFVITNPVTSTYPVKDSDPEWMKNGEWDISANLGFSCSSYGKLSFQPTGASEPMDKAPSEDFIFRKISASNPAQIKVQFSEGAILKSNCGLFLTQKFTTPSNFQLIAKDYADGKVDGSWIVEQLYKVQGSSTLNVSFVHSGLVYEWYTNIRDHLKGELVYDVQRDCPADKKSNSSNFWTVCSEPVTKTVQHTDERLMNKPLIAICNSNFTRTPLSITREGSTYPLPVESKTPATEFTITAKAAALSTFCFAKILN